MKMLVSGITPLKNTNELTCWENRPFSGVVPETTYKKHKGITKPLRKKTKRIRTAFTTEQLRALENTYTTCKYIDTANRKQLANILNIGEKCIKIWFQNRRMKEKRESESSDSSSDNVDSVSMSPSTVIDELSQANQEGQFQETVDYCIPNLSNQAPMQYYYSNNMYPTEYYPNNYQYYPNDIQYQYGGDYAYNNYWQGNYYNSC